TGGRGFTSLRRKEGQLQLVFLPLDATDTQSSDPPFTPLMPGGHRSGLRVDRSRPVRSPLFLPFRASASIEWSDCVYLLCLLLTSARCSQRLASGARQISR